MPTKTADDKFSMLRTVMEGIKQETWSLQREVELVGRGLGGGGHVTNHRCARARVDECFLVRRGMVRFP